MILKAEKAARQFNRISGNSNIFYAVHETDFELPGGLLTVLEGRSGSGKTTFLNMLSGLLRPTSGKILLDGRDIYSQTDKELSRFRNDNYGIVPQGQTAIATLTVMENVMLPGTIYGRDEGLHEKAEKLLASIGYKKEDLKDSEKLKDIKVKLSGINIKKTAEEIDVGEMTLKDIIDELSKPGRDPRDEMPKPILRSDVLKFEDLKEGMILNGTVRNVIDFGAFVDIGVKHDGLVHISELSESYVKNPADVVSIGDIVKVKVIKIDNDRQKVSLSMKI